MGRHWQMVGCIAVHWKEVIFLCYIALEDGIAIVRKGSRRHAVRLSDIPESTRKRYFELNREWLGLTSNPCVSSVAPVERFHPSKPEAARAAAIQRGDCKNLGKTTVERFKEAYENRTPVAIFDKEQRQDAMFLAHCVSEWRPYVCSACCRCKWTNHMCYLPVDKWNSVKPHPNCIPGLVCKTCRTKISSDRTVEPPPLDFGEIPSEVKKLTMYQRCGLSSLEPTNVLRRGQDSSDKIAFHYMEGIQNYFIRLCKPNPIDTTRGIQCIFYYDTNRS